MWSWGDGDYGKLGRGGSDGCKEPMRIESLAGLGAVKIECGSQFSVCLTRSDFIQVGGRGYSAVSYTRPQSFIITFSYSLA